MWASGLDFERGWKSKIFLVPAENGVRGGGARRGEGKECYPVENALVFSNPLTLIADSLLAFSCRF